MRNMKKAYFQKFKSLPILPTSLVCLTPLLSRPLQVGSELDADIAEYVRAARLAGSWDHGLF